MNILKVITPDNLGKGITFNPQTKQWEVQSGFDCAALSALPSKPWKKGTTLLAKQDGECIQLAALDSIFQEIGVGIAADKTYAFTGETYNVTVTVTNTGESKNELTNLTVQKPLLGNYEIQDVRTSKQGVDEVETLDQLNYNLKGLAKGGTFILRFSVKANDVGTYQFSATVNPNSALDQNAKNNTDTIILKANTKIDTTYVPSVDCPRITATELDSNTELVMVTDLKTNLNNNKKYINNYTCDNNNWNIFANRTDLKGLRIRLDGASTVMAYTKFSPVFPTTAVELSNGGLVYAGAMKREVYVDYDYIQEPDGGCTFNDGILEFTESTESAIILCRPAGKNCRWQALAVVGSAEPITEGFTASDVVNATVKYERSYSHSNNGAPNYIYNVIPSAVSYTIRQSTTVGHGMNHNRARVISKLIATVRSGNAASLNLSKNSNGVTAPISAGKTTITANRVTVAASATSTDSVNGKYLQVIVED